LAKALLPSLPGCTFVLHISFRIAMLPRAVYYLLLLAFGWLGLFPAGAGALVPAGRGKSSFSPARTASGLVLAGASPRAASQPGAGTTTGWPRYGQLRPLVA
jgi:hypothetical protein